MQGVPGSQDGSGGSRRKPVSGSPLMVVANRLPVRCLPATHGARWTSTRSSGGLVTALEPVLKRDGGCWIGWPGTDVEDDADRSLNGYLAPLGKREGFRIEPVCLNAALVHDFYESFSNRVLWPVFHQLSAAESREGQWWPAYHTANTRFARRLVRRADPRQFTWVHDYHLMLVAQCARREGYDGPMGFFLHTPFPPPAHFERLARSRALLDGLRAFDLVGFQTRADLANFEACLEHFADADTTPRAVRAEHFPISIDATSFDARARTGPVVARVGALRQRHAGCQIAIGVDRLDRTKGLENKLLAFERALDCYPELHRRIVLHQHVVPSRESLPEHRRLKRVIERRVEAINAEHARDGWTPVHYTYGRLSRDELVAHYRAASIALVTPLRDGMNLVAKEYCAASVGHPGVLVLSRNCGAAEELRHAAIMVDPFDIDDMARAIRRAVRMPDEERAIRMTMLRKTIFDNDVRRWADGYLASACDLQQRQDRTRRGAARQGPAGLPGALHQPVQTAAE